MKYKIVKKDGSYGEIHYGCFGFLNSLSDSKESLSDFRAGFKRVAYLNKDNQILVKTNMFDLPPSARDSLCDLSNLKYLEVEVLSSVNNFLYSRILKIPGMSKEIATEHFMKMAKELVNSNPLFKKHVTLHPKLGVYRVHNKFKIQMDAFMFCAIFFRNLYAGYDLDVFKLVKEMFPERSLYENYVMSTFLKKYQAFERPEPEFYIKGPTDDSNINFRTFGINSAVNLLKGGDIPWVQKPVGGWGGGYIREYRISEELHQLGGDLEMFKEKMGFSAKLASLDGSIINRNLCDSLSLEGDSTMLSLLENFDPSISGHQKRFTKDEFKKIYSSLLEKVDGNE